MSKINKVNFDGAYLRSSSGHFLFVCSRVYIDFFVCLFSCLLRRGTEGVISELAITTITMFVQQLFSIDCKTLQFHFSSWFSCSWKQQEWRVFISVCTISSTFNFMFKKKKTHIKQRNKDRYLFRITDVGGEAMERQKWFEIIEHYSVRASQ